MSVVIPSNKFHFRSKYFQPSGDLHHEEPRWFAVRVMPRKEKLVARLLGRDGVEFFLPLRERPFNYRSKAGVRQLPLLPSYIFVKIIAKESIVVQSTQYVSSFVKLGKEHRQVSQSEIDLLRRISTDDSLRWEVEEKASVLEHGTPVEIRRGPLAGVRGHYLHQKDKKTFVISFGGIDARLMSCEVSPEDIVPLDGGAVAEQPTGSEVGRKQLW